MRTRTIVALLLVVLAIGAGAMYGRVVLRPNTNVDRLVARALSRDAGVDYVANVVSTTNYNGKKIETRATVVRQGGVERIEYADASGRHTWLMTKGGKSYTFLPRDNKLLISETGKLLSDADRNALLLKNYKVVSDGSETIAGRNAYVVEISSRCSGRLVKKLWIDKQYLTILKSIDYSASGYERGRTQVKHIQYGVGVNPETFAIPAYRSVRVLKVCESGDSIGIFKGLGIKIRHPRYLPAGYVPEGFHLFHSQCNCDHRSAQLTYTDGLNVISVFQTPKMTCCNDGTCNMTDCGKGKGCAVANCDVAKTGVIAGSDRTIVVVGDLLPEEIKKIAESVR